MPTPLRLFLLPIAAAIAAPAAAQSPFDGTWKGELASAALQAKPNSYKLQDGLFSCVSCIPPYSVPADGKYHPVQGKDYWDHLAVSIVDDRTVRYSYRQGSKIISETTSTVSANGDLLATVSRDSNNGGNVPVEVKGTATRIGAPVPGAHLISGQWKAAPAASVSDAALTMTIKVEGDTLHMKSGLGETLRAKIGGAPALLEGDPGKTMIQVEQPDPRTLKMTDMRGGKVVQISTYTIGTDGKLRGSWTDPRSGDTGSFTATRQ